MKGGACCGYRFRPEWRSTTKRYSRLCLATLELCASDLCGEDCLKIVLYAIFFRHSIGSVLFDKKIDLFKVAANYVRGRAENFMPACSNLQNLYCQTAPTR